MCSSVRCLRNEIVVLYRNSKCVDGGASVESVLDHQVFPRIFNEVNANLLVITSQDNICYFFYDLNFARWMLGKMSGLELEGILFLFFVLSFRRLQSRMKVHVEAWN